MKDINLLQGFKSEKKQFDMKENGKRAGIVLGMIVIVLAAAYIGLHLANNYYIAQTEAVQLEAASYAAVSEAKIAVSQKETQIKNIQELLTVASGTSYVDTDFLWTISSALNENTFLTNASISESGSVNLSGKSATRKDITYFIYTLKKTALFSDVSVNMVNTENQESTGGADTYDFTVTASIKGGVEGE